jgi:hypothetical protein
MILLKIACHMKFPSSLMTEYTFRYLISGIFAMSKLLSSFKRKVILVSGRIEYQAPYHCLAVGGTDKGVVGTSVATEICGQFRVTKLSNTV